MDGSPREKNTKIWRRIVRSKKTKGGATALVMTLIVSSALASILGVRQVQRVTTDTLWIAETDLVENQMITRDLVREARGEKASGGIRDINALLGKVLVIDKPEGEPFYQTDMALPKRTWLAQKVPKGRVLYTLTPHLNSIPPSQVRNGDRFDVLATGNRGVRTIARDVRLIGSLPSAQTDAGQTGQGRSSLITRLVNNSDEDENARAKGVALVIAVKPQEIYPLAGIRPSEQVSLVLHGEREVTDGNLLDINPVRLSRHQVEILAGSNRRQVYTTRL